MVGTFCAVLAVYAGVHHREFHIATRGDAPNQVEVLEHETNVFGTVEGGLVVGKLQDVDAIEIIGSGRGLIQ